MADVPAGGAGYNTPQLAVGDTGGSPSKTAAGAPGGVSMSTAPAVTDPKDLKEGLDKVKPETKEVDIANLHPSLKTALAGLNKEYMDTFGSPITVTSGYRSLQKQKELYETLGPSKAAKPSPTAPHMFQVNSTPAAIAFDASSSQMNKVDAGLLDKYGFMIDHCGLMVEVKYNQNLGMFNYKV